MSLGKAGYPWKVENINTANSLLIGSGTLTRAAPFALQRAVAIARHPFLWLNLLCLDAPLVAICWQWLFARSFHLKLPSGAIFALFLTAWFIYVIDRFSDSISLPRDVPKSAREIFCLKHRRLWLLLIPSIALLDIAVVWLQLDNVTRLHGAIVAAFAGLYLIVNNRLSKIWKAIPIKEILVGSLFAAGTLLAFESQTASGRSTIAFAALLFAILCSFNCVSIAFWERDLDLAQEKDSLATCWPRTLLFFPIALVALTIASYALCLVDFQLGPLAICLASSAVLLALLHLARLSRDERVALADLVLLTPLIFFLVERIT